MRRGERPCRTLQTLVIRGGTVADGNGGEPYEADVAIVGGRIAEVGKRRPRAAATGRSTRAGCW